ncbi:MAG: hypothetical protein K0R03_1215 [Moraxellaceae bacterium]|jgi:hypothetical protein|nr:hypothetical protein [Moraxellaceae bacterium]
MANLERRADINGNAPRKIRRENGDEPLCEQDFLPDDNDEDYERTWEGGAPDAPSPFIVQSEFQEGVGEQKDFLEQFDEDLYNDREDPPAQGNTADVAMGDRRFGSDGEAYAEYAHRRPGEDSSVGMSRDPADIADEDEQP